IWLDWASDLSSTNSTQAHCVDAEHQPTDLAVEIGSTHRTSLEAVLQAPRDDPARRDSDDRVVEPLHDGLAASFERARLAAHLDRTGLPWRQHVIDHQSRYACPLDVAELLSLGEVVPADVDRVGVGVVPEGDGNDMGYAVLPPRGQPPEPLAPEAVDLGMAERAHGALLLAGHSHGHSTTHNQQDGKRPDRLLSRPEQRNDTRWYPMDDAEATHNRSVAGSRPASPPQTRSLNGVVTDRCSGERAACQRRLRVAGTAVARAPPAGGGRSLLGGH